MADAAAIYRDELSLRSNQYRWDQSAVPAMYYTNSLKSAITNWLSHMT